MLAAAAFVLSYGGIHKIALSAGMSASMARIFPVIFDAMLVVSCAAVLSLRAANWWHRTYAWLTALVLLAALAAAGAVHATGTHIPRKPAAATIAVLPWVLLLLAFSLLLSMLRQFRHARAAENGQEVTETAGLAAPRPAAPRRKAASLGTPGLGMPRLDTRGRASPDREPPPGRGWTSWNRASRLRSPYTPGPLPSPALPWPALPWPALPWPALPSPALPSPALPCRQAWPSIPCPRARAPRRPSRAAQSPTARSPAAQSPAAPVPGGPVPGGPVPAARGRPSAGRADTPIHPHRRPPRSRPGAQPPGTTPAGAQPAPRRGLTAHGARAGRRAGCRCPGQWDAPGCR